MLLLLGDNEESSDVVQRCMILSLICLKRSDRFLHLYKGRGNIGRDGHLKQY